MDRLRDVRGFTLIELVVVVALIAVLAAMGVPALMSSSAQLRLGNSARLVERELHAAKMKAVRSDRMMRVRFNCPAAGQFRVVEVLGTATRPAVDDGDGRAAARCSLASYPYPDTNRGFFALPNNDGPLQTLPVGVAFSAVQTIDFWPDGSAHAVASSTPLAAEVALRVYDVKRGTSVNRSITVNGLGKITLQSR